jgi:5,5'-dehydrodivanillate O-demethylase
MNSCDSFVRKTNYFNSLENSVDYTHPFFVHMRSEFTGIGVNREIPRVDAEETTYGILGKKCYSDGKITVNHILMPVAAFITVMEGTTTIEHLAYRARIDVYSHRTFESRPDIIGIQDTVAMQLQPPIGERPPDRLGRGDFAVILLRKIFSRELRALANGEPLKQWRWPRDLQPQLNVAEALG